MKKIIMMYCTAYNRAYLASLRFTQIVFQMKFPAEANQYDDLKRALSEKYPNDRIKYTEEKSDFIISVTKKS